MVRDRWLDGSIMAWIYFWWLWLGLLADIYEVPLKRVTDKLDRNLRSDPVWNDDFYSPSHQLWCPESYASHFNTADLGHIYDGGVLH